MYNKKIELLGMKLKHPIIVSSGPMGDNANSIKRLLEVGAAAVCTKTIAGIEQDNKKIFCYDNMIFNKDGYSSKSLEKWYQEIKYLSDANVIPNIFSDTPEQLSKIAKYVVKNGAKVIELCLSCPTTGKEPLCYNIHKLKEMCRKVRSEVDAPIIVKLLLSTSSEFNQKMVRAVYNIGIDGIAVSDSIPAMLFDKKSKYMFDGVGGLSGNFMKPLVLKFLYDVEKINIIKIAIGGVNTGQDVLDYINGGAKAVGVCSAILHNGNSVVKKIEEEYINLVK